MKNKIASFALLVLRYVKSYSFCRSRFGSGSRSSATFAVKHAHPPSKHAAPSVPKPSPVSRRQVPSVPKHKPAVRHEVAPHMVPKPDHKVSAPMESSK